MFFFRSISALLMLLASVSTQAATNPQVMIRTNVGEMRVELYPQKAPKTVENFLHYVQGGFYNGTVFHRVINNFMIQGGGFTPTLEQKKTEAPITNEADNGLKNEPGTLAMARSYDPNSATAQFFINLNNNLHLNFYKPEPDYYGYCVFGKVVKGLDVAKKIGAAQTTASGPFNADLPVEKIVIEEISPISPEETKAAEDPPVVIRKNTKQLPTKKKDIKHG
ncbi:MAG: peptidylprolyl isomerase [Sulfuricella denitrificans]|nr:peptidylprolyl isomerase [Sulfuricella denitrificans]